MVQKISALVLFIAAFSAVFPVTANSVEGAYERRNVVLDARTPDWRYSSVKYYGRTLPNHDTPPKKPVKPVQKSDRTLSLHSPPHGDHFVHVQVNVPVHLHAQEKELLNKLRRRWHQGEENEVVIRESKRAASEHESYVHLRSEQDELQLDRLLPERHTFPSIDVLKSGTRKIELPAREKKLLERLRSATAEQRKGIAGSRV